jgi:hypothetical protein
MEDGQIKRFWDLAVWDLGVKRAQGLVCICRQCRRHIPIAEAVVKGEWFVCGPTMAPGCYLLTAEAKARQRTLPLKELEDSETGIAIRFMRQWEEPCFRSLDSIPRPVGRDPVDDGLITAAQAAELEAWYCR